MPTLLPSPENPPLSQPVRPGLRFLVAIVLLVGISQYLVRGTYRALKGSGDFSGPYAASRVFWQGGNTYDTETLRNELKAAQVPGLTPYSHIASCLYPPQTFVLYSPLGLLKWQYAKFLLALINSILPIVALASLSWTDRQIDFRTLIMALMLVLFWAPLHSGIGLGQPAVVSVSLSLIAMQLAASNRQGLAGWVLAASVFAKVHDALPVVIYFALRRWWKSLLILAVVGAISTVFIGMWWGTDTQTMIQTLLKNYRFEQDRGLMSPSGPMNWQRIDVSSLWPGRTLGMAVLLTVIALPLTGLLAWRDRNRDTSGCPTKTQAISLACLSLWSLLVVYHRYYDAHVLLVPLLHGLQAGPWNIDSMKVKWAAGIGVLPFLAPLAAMVYTWWPEWRAPLHASDVGQLLMLHVNLVLLIAFFCSAWLLTRTLRNAGSND